MINKIRLLILLTYLYMACFAYADNNPGMDWVNKVGTRSFPNANTVYNVSDYGAISDGITMNTIAIQKAIDDCASKGGGIVTFSPGRYLTGSVYLKDNVHFIIPKSVTLLGSTDIKDYPEIDTRIAGIEMVWPSALINVLNSKNVMISGDGVVHAQGKVYWDAYRIMREEYEQKGLRWIVDYDCKRPRTLLVSESSDVTVKDITIKQAGFWTIQLLYSSFCTVDGVVIQNNIGGHGPSTDGIDIDSSSYILVENCDIDCNDDNFCLKAGRDADGLRVNRPTEYVVIRNCISRSGGGLLTCGSETSGGIRYVLADGLKAEGTTVGIRLKSAMNRGGTTEYIYVKNVEMKNVGTVFEATTNWNPSYSYSTLPEEYKNKSLPDHWMKMLEKVDSENGTPQFNNICLSDFKIVNSNTFMFVEGNNKSKMDNFFFKNIDADVEQAGRIAFAKNWQFENFNVRARDNQPLSIQDSENVSIPTEEYEKVSFLYSLNTLNDKSDIKAAKHPEFAFLLPEMAGNLKFGIVRNNESKWFQDFEISDVKQSAKGLIYTLSDPFLDKGEIIFEVLSLSSSDGVIIEVSADRLPDGISLFWSYGGAFGKILDKDVNRGLEPGYCKYNVFSVEWTAFTLYYGESMKLKTINAVMPVTSEIRLSDANMQQTPLMFYTSGKKTNAPALTGLLPLKNGQKEYFCIYRQNEDADYNHYMLSTLFLNERSK